MTQEECLEKLRLIDLEYEQTRRAAMELRDADRGIVLDAWAREHATYHIGDIIEAHGVTILVEKIHGYIYEAHATKLYCVYHGHALTKRLELRKDGWETNIHDDGREIKLVRKLKNG